MRPGGPCPAPELSLEPSGHFLGVREQRAGPRPSKAMHLGDTRTHCPHSGFRPADTSRVAGGQAPRVCSDFSCRGAVGQTAEEASPRGAQTRPPPPEAGLCVGRAQAGLGRAAARPAHSPRPPGLPALRFWGTQSKTSGPQEPSGEPSGEPRRATHSHPRVCAPRPATTLGRLGQQRPQSVTRGPSCPRLDGGTCSVVPATTCSVCVCVWGGGPPGNFWDSRLF